METHTVVAGECMATIAKKHGFYRWQTIYEAPENAELRKRRPNPNVLYPGDKVVIPDRRLKVVTVPTGRRHKIRVKSPKWIIRLEMKDDDMQPIEDEPFELHVKGKPPLEGKSGSEGLIEAVVPVDATSAKLMFMGKEFKISFGQLDPISRVTGVQARLRNLGYPVGRVDGVIGPRTRSAIYDFQLCQEGLEATGEIDDVTRRKLLDLHEADDQLVDTEEDMATFDDEGAGEAEDEGEEPAEGWDDDGDQGEEDWSDEPHAYED